MKYIKTLTREIIAPTLLKARLDKLMRYYGNSSILNLLYHGVAKNPDFSFSPRHISALQFEKQIKYLKHEFEIISLKKAFSYKRNSENIYKKAISISFDDGYKNNLTVALPILEKYKVPATIFVSGLCAEESNSDILFPDFIAGLRYFNKDHTEEIIKLVQKHVDTTISKTNLTTVLRSLKPEERKEFINELNKRFGVSKKIRTLPGEIWQLLNKDDLITLGKSNLIDIQSHGMHHHDLNAIGNKIAEKEIMTSKNILEAVLKKNITGFAYPNGSYNSELKDLVEQCGFTDQVAVKYLDNKMDQRDNRIINRYSISATTSYAANILLINKAFYNEGLQ